MTLQTDDTKGTYVTDTEAYNLLFRGDWREYPEHLWEIAKSLQTDWFFVLPHKPHRGRKSNEFAFFIMAMEEIKTASGEFNAPELLGRVRSEFVLHMDRNDGIAPFTVGRPTALIANVRAAARELRAKGDYVVKQPVSYKQGLEEELDESLEVSAKRVREHIKEALERAEQKKQQRKGQRDDFLPNPQ